MLNNKIAGLELQLNQMQVQKGLKNEELEGELMRNEEFLVTLTDLDIKH